MCKLSLPLATALLAFVAAGASAQVPSTKLLLSEDFESTPVGEIPKGFTKAGLVAVVDDVAHSGHKSLRMDPIVKGARTITKQGPEVAAIGGEHWGRLYFKVKQPVPAPVIPEGKTSGIIHSTMVSGKAMSPLFNDPIDVRIFSTVLNSSGAFLYLFNVQPKLRKEFGPHSKAVFHYPDRWTLAEWQLDHSTQTYRFFIDGEEIKEISVSKGAGQFEGAEIPAVFDSLTFGWTNYQPADGEGFTVWIDDIALGKERIGPTETTTAATAPAK